LARKHDDFRTNMYMPINVRMRASQNCKRILKSEMV
jgi:hypothetical protein